MLRKEKKHRPEVKVMGTSRNYNLHPSSRKPTFTRGVSGQRIMPLAQLNTFTGRILAEQQHMKSPMYTEAVNRTAAAQDPCGDMNGLAMHPVSAVNDGKEVVTATSRHGCNDRDQLPSQMLREVFSQVLDQPEDAREKQTVDRERLFIGTNSPSTFNIPASLLAPLCNTCISIPGYLLDEYLQFLPNCIVCGYMSAEILDQLASKDGELGALTDDSGDQIFGASKELKDWCVYIAKGIKKIDRHDSYLSLADTLSSRSSSGTLRRSGAVRRTSTSSTASSIKSNRSKHLNMVGEIPERCETPLKQFNFDLTPATTARSQFYRQTTRHISSGSSLGNPFYLETSLERPAKQPLYSQPDNELSLPPSAERPKAVKRTFSQILGHASPPTALRRSPGIHPLLPHPRVDGPSTSPQLDGEIHWDEVNKTTAT